MARVFICTQGTSIANGCEDLRELQRLNVAWGCAPETALKNSFEKELADNIAQLVHNRSRVEKSSAEITILAKAKIGEQDRVILLVTDTYLGEKCAEALQKILETHYCVRNVQIERIQGLQVHNRECLEHEGIGNFINKARRMIEEAQNVGEEVFLCPNGGFKGIVPFLTILGMRYRCRVLYTFEHAECLITLPSLPFTLDTTLYRRAERALKKLNEDVEQYETEYLNNIEDYDESERLLFLGFVERTPDGRVTPSAMLEPLLDAVAMPKTLMLSKDAIKAMEKLEGTSSYIRLTELIMCAQDAQWLKRKEHYHPLNTTDLVAIKPGRVAERLLGCCHDGSYYVARVYANHTEYDRDTDGSSAPQKKDYPISEFKQWQPKGLDTPHKMEMFVAQDEFIKELLDKPAEEAQMLAHLEDENKRLRKDLSEKKQAVKLMSLEKEQQRKEMGEQKVSIEQIATITEEVSFARKEVIALKTEKEVLANELSHWKSECEIAKQAIKSKEQTIIDLHTQLNAMSTKNQEEKSIESPIELKTVSLFELIKMWWRVH